MTVDVGQVVRAVDPQLIGVNATWWDTNLNTSQTQQMVEAAGLNLFRLPGGSSSDDFHFNAAPTYQGEGTIPSMASFVASVNGQAVVTLDYGSGSPQEAAAELAYLNAPVGATTPIGDGPEWNDTTSQWQTVNWQNAGYWASLRAATPLPVDDGLNFLRLGRAAPFGFHYFEVGNEEYGSWEIDHHTVQHDPATYVAFAKQFETFAAAIDPSISIGIDAGAPDNSYNNWIPDVLQQSVMQGFTIGFISDHNYVQAPGSESDSTLLLDTVSDPSSPFDWAVRATGYTDLLDQYLGAAAGNVELLTTEFNSVYSNPGKQTTSLVNGLFIADSLGELLQTSYDGAIVWALRNGPYDTSNNDSSSLYGWREGGDYGLLGTPPDDPPATGTYVPYPSYFAEQLASNIIQAGGSVVQASSNDPNLAVYAVHEANGDLDLLVINKSPSGPITGQFAVADFQPAAQAQVLQYGEAQDTAQSESSDGQSALASFTAALSLSGSSFSLCFSRVLDERPRAEPGRDRSHDHPPSRRGAESGHRHHDSPVGLGRRPGRGGLADLHLVHDFRLACRRCLQRQRHQRRPGHDSHLQPGGHLHLPGHRDRPQRPDRDQRRDGDGRPDPDVDQGQPRNGDGRGRHHAAVHGAGRRPVRQPDVAPAGLHLVAGRRDRLGQLGDRRVLGAGSSGLGLGRGVERRRPRHSQRHRRSPSARPRRSVTRTAMTGRAGSWATS